MLINELEKAIQESITNRTEMIEKDFGIAMFMAKAGGEQKGFTGWLIRNIEKDGLKGWWNPHCLFRTYHLRGKDPGTERANRIRAEIRAAKDGSCPFIKKPWNKAKNKEIFAEWISRNNHLIEQALKLNEGNPESTAMNSNSSNYLPTKEDCEAAIRQLSDENKQARTGQVLDRIEENVTSKGMTLKPNWRMITEENLKIWSS
ncbi:MAG: hypothetical protein R6U68_01055 [Desulfobacteraceae bacterium]